MSKEKSTEEYMGDTSNTSPSFNGGHGEGAPIGIGEKDACRRELMEYLELINADLGKLPNLAAIQTKENLEKVLGYFDHLEQTADPEMRQKMWAEIAPMIESLRVFMYVNGEIRNKESARRGMGITPPADPKRMTVIIPSEWDDRDKPLH